MAVGAMKDLANVKMLTDLGHQDRRQYAGRIYGFPAEGIRPLEEAGRLTRDQGGWTQSVKIQVFTHRVIMAVAAICTRGDWD